MLLRILMCLETIGLLLLGPIQTGGQVAQVSPQMPNWGGTLRLIYDPTAESATLMPGDEIYTVYFVFFADSSCIRWGRMNKKAERLTYQMSLEEDMAFLIFHFITLDDWDSHATVSTMVHRPDGVPARGAYAGKMTHPTLAEEYMKYFQKELELYPDNHAAYRDKWFVAGRFAPDSLPGIIERDIAMLRAEVKDAPVGLLYSLSYGNILLGDERQSREILQEMAEKYPESPYTGRAIDNYEYQVFSQQIQGEGPEQIEKMKWQLIQKHPRTRYARQESIHLAGEKHVPLAAIEAICEPWLREEPDNPMPYYSLAYACSERQQELNRAAELVDRALNLMVQGKLRLYDDISGRMTEMLLASCFRTSSDIQFHLGDHARALADIKAVRQISREPYPEDRMREAAIWRKAGSHSKAESGFLEAVRLGSETAGDSIRAIYLERHQTADGFETYLSKRLEKRKPESSEEKEMAPDFEAVTLDGQKLSLADLKGKVVVVNFWFTGCAPCKVEIPSLNRLTEEFHEEDVVFIAFASDEKDRVKKFLDKNPFSYHIVPNALEITRQFGVRVFPTHIIINREGTIEFRSTGGSEAVHKRLKPLVAGLLR